ncbi:hypothetical protein [Alteromonas ponticola]|uniref:Solute-binding protein family 3/N-terminal domain-containing protein n=1 Tax=Alteromonas ponticola TaxID=2720613 RepID=A0ABX1R393_9ALTE|nr:hypothetical protein [Alteromonas ponticola]NMH60121.1 hypothetical protein [Alteromonas ponticola]
MLKGLLALGLLLLHTAVFANDKDVVVSVVEHPLSARYKPLITESYQAVGLNVRFVTMPLSRRLIALDEGGTDADLVGRDKLSNHYNNVLRVGPKLATITIKLICSDKLRCGKGDTQHFSQRIFMDKATRVALRQEFKIRFNNVNDNIESPQMLVELFEKDRIDYFIFVDDESAQSLKLNRKHKSVFLGELDLYHHVNKKMQPIAKKLAEAMLSASQKRKAKARVVDDKRHFHHSTPGVRKMLCIAPVSAAHCSGNAGLSALIEPTYYL